MLYAYFCLECRDLKVSLGLEFALRSQLQFIIAIFLICLLCRVMHTMINMHDIVSTYILNSKTNVLSKIRKDLPKKWQIGGIGQILGIGIGQMLGTCIGQMLGTGIGQMLGTGIGQMLGTGIGQMLGTGTTKYKCRVRRRKSVTITFYKFARIGL